MIDPCSYAAAVAHAHSHVCRRYGDAAGLEYLADAVAQAGAQLVQETDHTTYTWPDGSCLVTTDGLLAEVL